VIRSYLFTPAHESRFTGRAHQRGADAVLLDLEDSVPLAQKARARDMVPGVVAQLSEQLAEQGAQLVIRVNRDLANCVADLQVACRAGVSAIMLPKVSGPDHIRLIDEFLCSCEREAGLEERQIGLIALIETPGALQQVAEIARASPRLTALVIGTEDFSAECGFVPTPENLFAPCQSLILAARAAGIEAIGLPGSIAEVQDIAHYTQTVQRAKSMGFDGVLCIHPKQVAVVNDSFAITKAESDQAQRIVDAYETALAQNRGAIMLEGKMIDAPVVARAQAVLATVCRQKSRA
jgi:citrate lyase subunit beta / citryl-CoA lyase